MSDKIAAIATGRARTGIGILRLSGDGCIEAAGQVFRLNSGRPLSSLSDRKLALGTLFDAQGRPIDHCMAFISRAPHSYTGEDTAEIQCHGSPAALTAGLEALFAAGFRQARPGEFTRRAFLNGQMDLTQAEAVIDLIDAETADAAANAAGQVAGAIRKKIDPIYDGWVDLCAHFHAVLDYPDEDIDPFALSGYEASLTESSRQLTALLASCHRGRMVQSGIRAVILGSPNAGKSSLLNRLSGFDRVIVTDIPGTTRDTVEQTVTLGRHLVWLVDTAGIRATDDRLEQMGIQRTMSSIERAQIVIYMTDAARLAAGAPVAPEFPLRADQKLLVLVNKTDTAPDCPLPEGTIGISARNGDGIESLRRILRSFVDTEALYHGDAIVSNNRHYEALTAAGDALRRALDGLNNSLQTDLLSEEIRQVIHHVGSVTGRNSLASEEVLKHIFSKHCVGK
mgnify:CR=1 FL=1